MTKEKVKKVKKRVSVSTKWVLISLTVALGIVFTVFSAWGFFKVFIELLSGNFI
ncbi:hypothetical protein [Mycoplasma sp. 480]|uniref:hypothetical protein n=1 Tax=Mycoplasma sp. 480 TaxID=3440155 RepID=UPI003F519817